MMLPPSPACSPSPRRLLASLYHPNLVQYHEAFVDHGKLCIVTELMPGGDLATSM